MPWLVYILNTLPWVFRGLFLWTIMWMRKEITKQFNIKFMNGAGGICLDCCCPWYCYCWSMQQDQKTIEELKPKPEEDLIGNAINAVTKVVKSTVGP
jgi:hypothetical protein